MAYLFRSSRKRASVLFVTLAIVFLLFSGCESAPKESNAGATDEGGEVTFRIEGEEYTFRFMNEIDKLPLEGLSVAVALGEIKSSGIIMAIDPQGRVPMQIIELVPGQSSPITGYAIKTRTMDVKLGSWNSILDRIPIETIKEVKEAKDNINEIMDLAVLGAKILKQSGLPIGDYEEVFDDVKVESMYKDEASDQFFNDVKDLATDRIFFFFDPEFVIDPQIPSPKDLVLDTLNLAIDANAIFSCGLPNERVTRMDLGSSKIYGCRSVELKELVEGMARVPISAVDQYGLPLGIGSIELFSNANLGFGLEAEIIGGQANVVLPGGIYSAMIDADGYIPYLVDVDTESSLPVEVVMSEITPAQDMEEEAYEEHEEYDENAVYFWGGDIINPYAIQDMPYTYSFCKPELAGVNDVCPSADTYDPSGGNPPYHFTLEPGTGFLPMGLVLHPNGMITGTPTSKGTSDFGICAVDESGKQACNKASLEVKGSYKVNVHVSGEGRSMLSDRGEQNCSVGQNCTFIYEEGSYVKPFISFSAENGSGFRGWSGACVGSFLSCSLEEGSADAGAEFSRMELTLDSVRCEPASKMDGIYKVELRGTASAPKGTDLMYFDNINDLNERNPGLNLYEDPMEGGTCGTWDEGTSMARSCSSNGDAIYWVITIKLFGPEGGAPIPFAPGVYLSQIGSPETERLSREVICG